MYETILDVSFFTDLLACPASRRVAHTARMRVAAAVT